VPWRQNEYLSASSPASGHNTQPWRFEINHGRLHLYANRSRRPPVVDPTDGTPVISCGAALGLLLAAAAALHVIAPLQVRHASERNLAMYPLEIEHEHLVAASREARLVVIGPPRAGGDGPHGWLGLHLLRRSRCPGVRRTPVTDVGPVPLIPGPSPLRRHRRRAEDRASEHPGGVMSNITNATASNPPGPGPVRRPVVAALGDDNQHDLGVGPAVLRHLRGRGLDLTLVHYDAAEPALVEFPPSPDAVIVVDPVRAEPCHPGRVHRFVMSRPDDTGTLVVFAVEAGDTAAGAGLSPAVAAAARRVADAIAAEIGAARSPAVELAARWSSAHRNYRTGRR
jgi:hydrogenase maturation protease